MPPGGRSGQATMSAQRFSILGATPPPKNLALRLPSLAEYGRKHGSLAPMAQSPAYYEPPCKLLRTMARA